MKKFLLIAMAAMFVGSASAQQLSAKKSGKAQSQLVRPHMAEKLIGPEAPVKQVEEMPVRADMPNYGKKIEINTNPAMSAMPSLAAKAVTARKAGVLKESYTGVGKEYGGGRQVWTMFPAALEDGTPVLVNIVPSPFSSTPQVPVEYTLSGNTLTIAPQLVYAYYADQARTTIYWVFAVGTGENGNIEMKLTDDGQLIIDEEDQIVYGVYTENACDPTFGDTYLGYYQIMENITYYRPEDEIYLAPEVMYAPDGVYLNAGFSYTGYQYNNNVAFMPAYTNVSFKNWTTDAADTWWWGMNKLQYNSAEEGYDVVETKEADTKDFTNYITSGTYTPPTLVAHNGNTESEAWQWGTANGNKETAYTYAGFTGDSYQFSDESYAFISKVDPDKSWQRKSNFASSYRNSAGWTLQSLILYQGKPQAPLYFEGVKLLVYNRPAAPFEARDGFNLKCKIQKVSRSETGRIAMGDVIAEADVDVEDIKADYFVELNWNNFYVEDEDGLSESVDYLLLDEEFAIVFEGWDNGTFTAVPIGDAYYNVNGLPNTYFMADTDGEGASIYSWTNNYTTLYAGFKNAAYGYLYTEDATTYQFPVEGGEYSIHVKPYLYTVNESGDPETRIYLDEGSEIPSWLEVEYTSPATTDDISFDLKFKAAALPEGVEGRDATFSLYQEGARLTFTALQGNASGISKATTATKAAGKVYNMAGQQVKADAKGIVVKDGKKVIVK